MSGQISTVIISTAAVYVHVCLCGYCVSVELRNTFSSNVLTIKTVES